MNCPVCSLPLKMTDRNGIEIDYCEKCRGVWLDRGELDKIIERSGSHSMQAPQQYRKDEGYGNGHSRPDAHHRRERENPMAELFDFF